MSGTVWRCRCAVDGGQEMQQRFAKPACSFAFAERERLEDFQAIACWSG